MRLPWVLARLHTYRRDLVPLGQYVILLVAMAASSILKIIIPMAVESFIDKTLRSQAVSPASTAPLLLLLMAELGLSRFAAYYNFKLSNESMVHLQVGVLEHLIKAR